MQVSLNLKDTVITEPELTAGNVLWSLIKAEWEESHHICGKGSISRS